MFYALGIALILLITLGGSAVVRLGTRRKARIDAVVAIRFFATFLLGVLKLSGLSCFYMAISCTARDSGSLAS